MNSKNFASQTEADHFFMEEAFRERLLTDDPKGKIVLQSAVGAVITIGLTAVASSANVLPPLLKFRMVEKGEIISEEARYYIIEHAERAVIFKAQLAGQGLAGGTIYCTRFPCSDCARAIVFVGLKRAVFAGGFGGELRWLDSQRAALRILRDGGVTIRYLRSTFAS